MFLVITESPLDDEWEQRDQIMYTAAGRPPYYSGATCCGPAKQRDHEWHMGTIEEARDVKLKFDAIPKVISYIRED